MITRIVAALLAISLAACSSVPRLAPAAPRSPVDADASPSASTKGDEATSSSASARDDTASNSAPEPKAADSTREDRDTSPPTNSHLTEIGRGLLLVALFALLVWLNYLMVCGYCY